MARDNRTVDALKYEFGQNSIVEYNDNTDEYEVTGEDGYYVGSFKVMDYEDARGELYGQLRDMADDFDDLTDFVKYANENMPLMADPFFDYMGYFNALIDFGGLGDLSTDGKDLKLNNGLHAFMTD